jgi:predicted ATPase/DNA-binding CsgD family transcriptional regulator
MAQFLRTEGTTAERVRSNLPHGGDRLIGREAELAYLERLLPSTRLLALVGPGGVGKTRLALRVGDDSRSLFTDGVWLVDVAPLAAGDVLAQRVADVLGIPERTAQSWFTTLTEQLGARRLLLILDTCEHHREACAELAQRLLDGCPMLQILATSREPLDIPGEIVWRVPRLSLPATDELPHARASAAVQLFVAKASAVLRGFRLTEGNVADVARICRDLDGLPLGLELVAGHVANLGLSEIAERVHAHLALSLTGRRDAPARQQTLRATFDWSYASLSDRERMLLRRLAVFVGGWTIEAARTVCGDAELAPASIGGLLEQLQAKSLVVEVAGTETPRYRLLDATRLYALDLLVESHDWRTVAGRHLEWCRALSERVPSEALDIAHARQLEIEEDNMRAALGWALASGDTDSGLRIAVAALPLWFYRGHIREARYWLDRFLELATSTTDPSLRGKAIAWRAQLLLINGDFARAETELEHELVQQQQRGDAIAVGHTNVILGNAAFWRGDLDTATRYLTDALALLAQSDNRAADIALAQLGRIAVILGDSARARDIARRLRQIHREYAQPLALSRAFQIEAALSAATGDVTACLRQLDEAMSIQTSLGDRNGFIDSLTYRGQVLLNANRHPQARVAFRQAALVVRGTGDQVRLTRAIEGLACTLVLDQPETTVRLIAAAAQDRSRFGAELWPRDRDVIDAALGRATADLTAEGYANAWHLGRSMLDADVFSLAVSEPTAPNVDGVQGRDALTPREREVVRLIVAGMSPPRIGEFLVISPATVRKHLERAMAKLGVHSRVQLARWAAAPGVSTDES